MVMVLIGFAVIATVFAFAMPIIAKDQTAKRMKVMATERDKMRASRLADMGSKDGKGKLRNISKGMMQDIVDQLNLRSMFETDELRDNLKMAGLRGQGPLTTYMFFRIAAPILMFALALFYLFAVNDYGLPPIMRLAMSLGASYLGYYLPNVFISNMISKRQTSIKQAFPDSLDMLLICVQAGMSIEAAFGKVSKEVSSSSLELAEELSLTTAELSYLQDRRSAYENLAKRTGLPGVKSVCTALVQAERYGTPVGQALRVMAKENRDMRMSEAEKKAAQLPPKLTVPMILFFLPVMFLVILGPAAIGLMQSGLK